MNEAIEPLILRDNILNERMLRDTPISGIQCIHWEPKRSHNQPERKRNYKPSANAFRIIRYGQWPHNYETALVWDSSFRMLSWFRSSAAVPEADRTCDGLLEEAGVELILELLSANGGQVNYSWNVACFRHQPVPHCVNVCKTNQNCLTTSVFSPSRSHHGWTSPPCIRPVNDFEGVLFL